MASSISDPQLLINEGELDEILRIIDNKKKPQSKIVGNLFGLWRNSLIQPVVQLITGPGAGAKTSKETFKPDVDYQKRIKKYLQNKHGLLQIGLWFYGNVNRYPRFDQGNRDFNGDNLLIPRKGNHVVLMFVDDTRGNLEIEYQIINTSRPESPRVAHLTAQDVLPGASGFRLLKPVFDKINRWAKFPYRENQQTRCFSTNMLQSSTSTTSKYHTNNATPVTSTNATAIPSPMVRPSSQWYESDGGSNLLRRLVDDFKSKSVSVEISRDSRSHDITLELDRGICLHFPADFPTGLMSLTWSNDTSTFTRNPNEICRTISDRASNVLSGETVRRMSRTTRL